MGGNRRERRHPDHASDQNCELDRRRLVVFHSGSDRHRNANRRRRRSASLHSSIRVASIAIGKGPHNTGSVYVAWSNAASTPADRLSSTGVYGFSEIEFSSSPSGGANWSNPVRVNNNTESASTPTDQFEPAIGTDKTGEIVVCFYDRRRDNDNFLIDRYCGTSTNFGSTWTNTKVTTSNFAPLVGEDALVALDYMGEYDAVVSDMLNKKSGLMAPYASNAPGNPTVEMKKF